MWLLSHHSYAKFDQFGYSSDTPRKCRSAILNWIDTGELNYAVRTKNVKQKGRIDHLLATPSLMLFISESRYIFHEYEITDHACLIFTIDIEKAEKGLGVFRANPALLKHPNYKTLINNVIRFSVIDVIKNKDSTLYKEILENFNNKIAKQEEIVNLEVVECKFGWKVSDRLNSQKDDLMFLKQKEDDIDTLLTLELDTDKDELIRWLYPT